MSIICISRLPILLKERQMTVLSLQRQLAQQGRIISKNTLYRLASWQPLKKVDLTIAGEICSLLGIGLSELFVIRRQKEGENNPLTPFSKGEKRVTFTDEQKARMRILLELAREGKITPKEERELHQLVDEEWEAAIDAAEETIMAAYPDLFKPTEVGVEAVCEANR
jgi:phage terminase small subunit